MLSGKFLKAVSVRLENLHPLLHCIDLLLIHLDLPFLTLDLQAGLGPMDPCITWTYDPDQDEDSSADSKENSEILMLSLKYVSKLAQNRTD